VLGEALSGGRREKVKIATKQPLGAMTTKEAIRINLENTLKKLRTSYIDAYLIHNINPGSSWESVKTREIIGEFEKFKSEGLIRAIGFSYHGDAGTFKDVLGYTDWAMCQIQQNFIDVDAQATENGITLAGKKGVALVIMEPLRGGGLATPPPPIQAIYDAAPLKRSAVEWAFRHLIDRPEISCVLSGVTTLEQLKENIAIFSKPDMVAGCLSAEEKATIKCVREKYAAIRSIPCTACEYCMPCPKGVQIPHIFSLYNDGVMFGNFEQPSRSYFFTRGAKGDASHCAACGACEKKCPQRIGIIEQLKTAHRALDGWIE
jgi:predicted aldo/keto reductase-like oxidoreductase